MKPTRFHREAQAEFEEAKSWYWKQSPISSLRFDDEVDRVLRQIVAETERYPHCNELFRFASLKDFPYRIIYCERSDVIWVIAIAHGSRRPGYWEERK